MSSLRQTASRLLRLGLPLSALVLLSTIFLVSRNVDPNRAAALSDLDLAQITREPRIATARFAGVMDDATTITVSADAVRSLGAAEEEAPLDLSFAAPDGELQFPNASLASFRADTARLDQRAGRLTAEGPVTLENSDGYILQMGGMEVALDQTRLVGTGGVQGQAPAGDIRADALELTRSGGADGGYLLAFTGNVRLLYIPQ